MSEVYHKGLIGNWRRQEIFVKIIKLQLIAAHYS